MQAHNICTVAIVSRVTKDKCIMGSDHIPIINKSGRTIDQFSYSLQD